MKSARRAAIVLADGAFGPSGVAAVLAAPAASPQATNDWTAFAKLKGAQWQGSAPKRGGSKHYFCRHRAAGAARSAM